MRQSSTQQKQKGVKTISRWPGTSIFSDNTDDADDSSDNIGAYTDGNIDAADATAKKVQSAATAEVFVVAYVIDTNNCAEIGHCANTGNCVVSGKCIYPDEGADTACISNGVITNKGATVTSADFDSGDAKEKKEKVSETVVS